MARADAGDCDLVAKSFSPSGAQRGYVYTGAGVFLSDRHADGYVSASSLWSAGQRANASVTYTCVPPGSGVRIGIDRDLDGVYDGD
jgi:hypothetical protein